MGSARSLLLLLIVALGLGAYIYFVELEREPADSLTAKKDKVFTADSATFEEVEVRAASGETTTLKKANGIWEIVKPEPLPADSTEIGSLLSTLDTLEIQRVIEENPPSPADFGLAPPRFSVAFKAAGDAAMKRLEVGRKTPTGGDLYARVEGQPRVFLISAFLEDSINKTPFGLRDKTALKFDRDAVDALTLEVTGSPTLAFAKKGNEWRFTKPYDAKADFTTVDGIVSKLSSTKMTAIEAADGTKDQKKYGLEKPQAVVTIGAGSTTARLAIGGRQGASAPAGEKPKPLPTDKTPEKPAETATGPLYARDLSRPMVFTVEASLLDDLKKKPEDLRKKDVFEFRSFSALGLDVTLGGKTFTITKQKAAAPADPAAATPPDVWKLTKPEAKDLDQTKIVDFFTTVSNLKAESFVDKPVTGGEEIVVTARFGEEKAPVTETVRFRKSGKVVHAMLAGEGGALVVSTTDFDRALALIKELTGSK
jgi:hypothetical protein